MKFFFLGLSLGILLMTLLGEYWPRPPTPREEMPFHWVVVGEECQNPAHLGRVFVVDAREAWVCRVGWSRADEALE